MDRPDHRFVGRKKLIEKLRGLLNDSETKSGAYLITGYRGAGKTSLVNKVLAEVADFPPVLRSISHYIWFVVFYLSCALFLPDLRWIWFMIGVSVVFAGTYIVLSWPLSGGGNSRKLLRYLLRPYKTHDQFYFSLLIKFMGTLLFYALMLESTERHWLPAWPWIPTDDILSPLFLAFLLFLLLEIVYGLLKYLELKTTAPSDKTRNHAFKWTWKRIKYQIKRFFLSIKHRINYSYRIVIKLNLGHENLREKDVLKIMAKNVFSRYNQLNSIFWRFPFNFKVFKSVILYLVICHWLAILISDADRNEFYDRTGLSKYFPSQVLSRPDTALTYRFYHIGGAEKTNPDTADASVGSVSKKQRDVQITAHEDDLSVTVQTSDSLHRDKRTWLVSTLSMGDFLLNSGYQHIRQYLRTSLRKPLQLIPTKLRPPNRIGYLSVLAFLIAWYLVKWFSFFKPFGMVSHAWVYHRLRELILRMDAEVSREKGEQLGSRFTFFRFTGRQMARYPIADVREIESEVISIFEDIDKIPPIFGKPSFIFLADELDKIQANQNKAIADRESQESDLEYTHNEFIPSTEITRQRQQVVATLLANLKHFFTTVRAKFIFIAGREMYDYALADVSDRNYFLGSIFHEVLYVPSFLTDRVNNSEEAHNKYKHRQAPDHMSYYHTCTEEYVCQFILPPTFLPGESRSLKTVHKYLLSLQQMTGLESYSKQTLPRRYTFATDTNTAASHRLAGVIQIDMVLKSFINYLTHRSGGTPKKLAQLFESYLEPYKSSYNGLAGFKKDKCPIQQGTHGLENSLHASPERGKERRYYLRFTLHDLYTFAMISYLTVPFYQNISRYIRYYGDKLLVSTSYLLDHFYKFHNVGFSWRNLEVTPEIIDINKAPVLRKIMHEIVDFLAFSNLEVLSTGLYDYKFNSKIAREIEFLSKVSEKESAALNFTLDESQEIKKHFKRKLKLLFKENPMFEHKKDGGKDGPGMTVYSDFVHSVTQIQHSLGDLHYYDQEYDDAITCYQNAVHMIRRVEERILPSDLLLLYIRIMLKLGHSFEKKRSIMSALTTYSQLSLQIIASLDIDVAQLELKKVKISGRNFVVTQDGQRQGWETEMDYHKHIVALPFSYNRFHMLDKSLTIETIRHLFQPFIAKLYAIEKIKNGGVQGSDLRSTLDELANLLNLTTERYRNILQADYYNKIGDLLFYKNSMDISQADQFDQYMPSHIRDLTPGNPALAFYLRGLELMGFSNLLASEGLKSKDIKATMKGKSFEELKSMANHLSDIGESWLTKVADRISVTVLSAKAYEPNGFGIMDVETLHLTPDSNLLQQCIFFFRQSAHIHLENNDPKRAAFQHLKILHALIAKVDFTESDQPKATHLLDNIRKKIMSPLIEYMFRTYSASLRPEIEKVKQMLKLRGDLHPDFAPYIFTQLPQMAELQEAISLFQFIKIRVHGSKGFQSGNILLEDISPGFYPNPSSGYNRAIQMSVKVRANAQLFKLFNQKSYNHTRSPEEWRTLFNTLTKKETDDEIAENILGGNTYKKNELFEYLVCDSIYCLTELIRTLQNFGANYLANHSFFGYVYEKRAYWAEIFMQYLQYQRDEREKKESCQQTPSNIYTRVRKLIGAESMDKLRPKFNFEKAADHYKRCLELHRGRFIYNSFMENTYYMDDQFNDEYMHFYFALERSKLDLIVKKTKLCRAALKDKSQLKEKSELYDVDRYFCADEPAQTPQTPQTPQTQKKQTKQTKPQIKHKGSKQRKRRE